MKGKEGEERENERGNKGDGGGVGDEAGWIICRRCRVKGDKW